MRSRRSRASDEEAATNDTADIKSGRPELREFQYVTIWMNRLPNALTHLTSLAQFVFFDYATTQTSRFISSVDTPLPVISTKGDISNGAQQGMSGQRIGLLLFGIRRFQVLADTGRRACSSCYLVYGIRFTGGPNCRR